jgi:hypothetical protein
MFYIFKKIISVCVHVRKLSSKFDVFLREKNFLFIFPVKFISKLKFLIMTEYLVLARHTYSSCKEMYDRLDIIHYIEETCPQHYHRPVIIVRAYQCTVKSFNLINFNTVYRLIIYIDVHILWCTHFLFIVHLLIYVYFIPIRFLCIRKTVFVKLIFSFKLQMKLESMTNSASDLFKSGFNVMCASQNMHVYINYQTV